MCVVQIHCNFENKLYLCGWTRTVYDCQPAITRTARNSAEIRAALPHKLVADEKPHSPPSLQGDAATQQVPECVAQTCHGIQNAMGAEKCVPG